MTKNDRGTGVGRRTDLKPGFTWLRAARVISLPLMISILGKLALDWQSGLAIPLIFVVFVIGAYFGGKWEKYGYLRGDVHYVDEEGNIIASTGVYNVPGYNPPSEGPQPEPAPASRPRRNRAAEERNLWDRKD